MKPLTTAGQMAERLKDREAQRQSYIRQVNGATGDRKARIEEDLKRVEGQIRDLKAMRLADAA